MKKQKFAIGAVVFWCVMALSGAAWCGDNGRDTAAAPGAPWSGDNGNGTVTVNGLVWLKDAGCLGFTNWSDAMARPKTLANGQCGLTDKSKAGDWRLPNIDELKAIYSSKSQFKGVQTWFYWSSTPRKLYGADYAGVVFMPNGDVSYQNKMGFLYVWPVRAGQ